MMFSKDKLRVILIKPSKYAEDGSVERFWRGFIPNSTLSYMYSMTLAYIEETGANIELFAVDEYVQDDLDYLQLLEQRDSQTLVALVGVQSHQFHRALDLAALARKHGAHAVIGGPHTMTCDTTMIQNRGVSFALAEAELIWETILRDATRGELQPVYGRNQRWQRELDSPVIRPQESDLRRYICRMIGIYPARGCPFRCNFCSVIKIAGRNIRSQTIETTMESLHEAKKAGVKLIAFTSDNFNKIPGVRDLIDTMIKEEINLRFFVQCDTQIGDRDSYLIPLLAKAGCFQMFVGVESFSRRILREAKKFQNNPDRYVEIIKLCDENKIATHFSNIIGFPGDTEAGILEHLRMLRSLNPTLASFYILTPIPGTEQYDDFRAKKLIFESNLDRFDATCPTWHHDVLSPKELRRLLFYCYRKAYSLRDLLRKNKLGMPGFMYWYLFSKFSAFKQTHPMSGGIRRIRLDHVDQYLSLREKTFGFDRAPLPDSLKLSPADEALNRQARLA